MAASLSLPSGRRSTLESEFSLFEVAATLANDFFRAEF